MTLKEFSESLGTFYRQKGIDDKISSLASLLTTVFSYFFEEYDKVDDVEFSAVHYKAHLSPAERKTDSPGAFSRKGRERSGRRSWEHLRERM